jgi:hypothetical protein
MNLPTPHCPALRGLVTLWFPLQVRSFVTLKHKRRRRVIPFAGGASDLYPSGPALLPGYAGVAPDGMLMGLPPPSARLK